MSQSSVIDSAGLEQFEKSDSSIRFGHLRYEEVATENLVCLNDGVWLHKHAASAFLEMSNAMHRDGVAPVIIKIGYRSYKRQTRTFEYYRLKKELGTVKTLTRVAYLAIVNIILALQLIFVCQSKWRAGVYLVQTLISGLRSMRIRMVFMSLIKKIMFLG